MRISLEPLELIEVNIPFNPPKKLEALAKKSQGKGVLKGDIVFPPISIEMILEIFLKKEFEKLNFFDIMKLLNEIKKDTLKAKIKDKVIFVQLLQKLFTQSPRYIKNFILKKITNILKSKENHSLKNQLSTYMNSKEFRFIKDCIHRNFKAIKKEIVDKSLKQKLNSLSLKITFLNLSKEYALYLIKEIERKKIMDTNTKIYENNLLDDGDNIHFYIEIEKLLSLAEKKIDTENIDKLLSHKLGDINTETSNWHTKKVPLDLQDRYRRLKGIFEFQRFVTIAEYLAPSLRETNISHSGKTTDEIRLRNRSLFWSNYDERFSSVQMWVSREDYKNIEFNRIVSLDKIKTLEDINSEVCLLEFKEESLIIIEFFRLRDKSISYKSLIIEDDYVNQAKSLLSKHTFNYDLYKRLVNISSFKITHDFLWQGWVDKFLRDRNIYPNKSILNGKKFQGQRIIIYSKSKGLEQTRLDALANDRVIRYENVITELNCARVKI
jgi:hypothetical protein